MTKAIVLSSGGLDSTTCLAMAVKNHGAENVMALTMYYGQKHDKELECAKKVAKHYKVKQTELNLAKVFEGSECTLLKDSPKPIPKGTYKDQKEKTDEISTYVPYRNGIFLSVATALALINGYKYIYYGAHADDIAENAYPDCSIEFNDSIKKAIYYGSGGKVQIKAPFINKTKADVVSIGLKLNVPYEMTWSCYKGGEKPCGKCATCIDRDEAFKKNGAEDPLWTS